MADPDRRASVFPGQTITTSRLRAHVAAASRGSIMKTQARILMAVLGSLACGTYVNTAAASDPQASGEHSSDSAPSARRGHSERHLRSARARGAWSARATRETGDGLQFHGRPGRGSTWKRLLHRPAQRQHLSMGRRVRQGHAVPRKAPAGPMARSSTAKAISSPRRTCTEKCGRSARMAVTRFSSTTTRGSC